MAAPSLTGGKQQQLERPRLCPHCQKFDWCAEKDGFFCDCGKIKKNLSLGAKIEKVNSAAKILGPVERKHSRKLSARKPFEFAVKKEEKTPTVGANLFVHLQGGRDLVARDLSGFSDPYVVIELGKKKFKSKRTPQTLFPRWNEVFAFEFPTSEDKVLHFTVMDWDRLTKDDFMGEFSVDVSELELDQPAQSEWIPLESRPGKPDKITGEIQLQLMRVSNPEKFISEQLNFTREIVLEGPVTLKKEKCWAVLFNSEELAFCTIPDQKIPDELKDTGVLRNGATMKKCMSPVHQITSPLQNVCLYSEDGTKPPQNPIVKEELQLIEIQSMDFTSSTSITLRTTRAKPAECVMNFSNEEEAMEWFICLRTWQRSLQSPVEFRSLLKKQYQEAYSGGCLKSGYNEEWQYSADGSFACIDGEVEGLKGTWDGQTFSFVDQKDHVEYGFGTWDGYKMCWWKAPDPEWLAFYQWNRLDQEYTSENSNWMWTRHFLANKNGGGEWITEGSVPEPFVMFLEIFHEVRMKKL